MFTIRFIALDGTRGTTWGCFDDVMDAGTHAALARAWVRSRDPHTHWSCCAERAVPAGPGSGSNPGPRPQAAGSF